MKQKFPNADSVIQLGAFTASELASLAEPLLFHNSLGTSSPTQHASTFVAMLQGKVSSKRMAAEAFILQHVRAIPESVGPPGHAFRLQVLSAAQPAAAPSDLMSLAWGPLDKLTAFNPFLEGDACGQLRDGVLLWLQLCVLEDRLERLQQLAVAGDEFTPLLIRVCWRSRSRTLDQRLSVLSNNKACNIQCTSHPCHWQLRHSKVSESNFDWQQRLCDGLGATNLLIGSPHN